MNYATEPSGASDDDQASDEGGTFTLEPGDIEAAVAALDVTHVRAMDTWHSWEALRDDSIELREPLRGQLQLAFSYRLELEVDGKAGCELVVTEHWPAPVRGLPNATIELWDGIAAKVSSPASVARFEDLLFCRGHGNGLDRATRAVDAYCSAADEADDLLTAEYLVRAWTLARRVRRIDLEDQALVHLGRIIAREVNGDSDFLLGPLLSVLASVSDSGRGPGFLDVDAALTHIAQHSGDTILATAVASFRRKRLDDSATAKQLDEIAREELAAYERVVGEVTHPMVRQRNLENAARKAMDLGLTADAQRIVAQMQRLGPEVIRQMHAFPIEFSVPRVRIEAFIRHYTRSPSWVTALQRFLYSTNPGGELARHRKFAESRRSSLLRLVSSGLVGADGLTREHRSTQTQQDLHDMSINTSSTAQYFGSLLADSLFRMEQRYGPKTEDELIDALLVLNVRNIDNARVLAKALRFFWAHDYDTCVHLAVPRFEGAARELLLELGLGIYRVPVGDNPGDYPGLFGLLKELETLALDEDWVWFFRWLMLGPNGRKRRNDVAHGAANNIGPIYAALALRALAMMALAAPDLSDPTKWSAGPKRPFGLMRIPDRVLETASQVLARGAVGLHDMRIALLREVPSATPDDQPADGE